VAIRPEDLLQFTDTEAAKLTEGEANIDEQLRARGVEDDTLLALTSVTRRMAKELSRRYVQMGWNVKLIWDGKNGGYLWFKGTKDA